MKKPDNGGKAATAWARSLAAVLVLSWGMVSVAAEIDGRLGEVTRVIADLEQGVSRVCRDADRGALEEPVTLVFGKGSKWLRAEKLRFSSATMGKDLDAALAALGRYKAIRVELQKKANTSAGNAEKQLRDAEGIDTGQEALGEVDFSVLESYSGDHKARREKKDRLAEDDMARVAQERRLAEEEQLIQREKEQKIQKQNAQWQAEMDSLVQKEVEAEAAWRREHSAGAFCKNLVRTVAGGLITSTTAGFASSIGAGLADMAVRDAFPDFSPSGRYDRGDLNRR